MRRFIAAKAILVGPEVISEPFYGDEWNGEWGKEQWHVVSLFCLCHTKTTEVILSKEHQDYAWVDEAAHKNYSLLPQLRRTLEVFFTQRRQSVG